jgi:hypothetical protein
MAEPEDSDHFPDPDGELLDVFLALEDGATVVELAELDAAGWGPDVDPYKVPD